MQADEILAIEGKHDSILRSGEGQDILVRQCLVGGAGLQDRQHIVAEPAQRHHYRLREVLVGI
jgi:hypothetical protein